MACDCCRGARWRPLFPQNGLTLGQCETCNLLYVDDIPDPQLRMTEMEEGHYAGTEEIVEAEKQSESENILLDRFTGYVQLGQRYVPSGRWLDIGCGAGVLLQLARQAGYEIEGIELSADRRILAEKATGARIHGEPLENLNLPDNSVDVVSMINVFSHLISPTQTFEELKRILKPGGAIVMATGEMGEGIQKGHMYHWNLGDHLYFLGDDTVHWYADKLNLKVAHHHRQWLPDALFSREWLRLRGRSGAKNVVKTTIDKTPGGLALMRKVMLRRHRDSAAYSSEFVLRA